MKMACPNDCLTCVYGQTQPEILEFNSDNLIVLVKIRCLNPQRRHFGKHFYYNVPKDKLRELFSKEIQKF